MEFIAIAEESSLINEIGRIVFQESCLFAKTLVKHGFPNCQVKINISPYQLRERNFYKDIETMIQDLQIQPKSIGMEITENIFMEFDAELEKVFADLSQLGIQVSLDDFGTGYSNLSSLQKLPIDSLKLDRSLLTGVVGSERNSAIAAAIIALAHSLYLKVIAEGVENPEQLKFLRDHDCDYGQGFIFSPALSSADFINFLKKPIYVNSDYN